MMRNIQKEDINFHKPIQYKQKIPTVLAVSGGKGGVGKTLTTANLGLCMARMGMRTLLIDGDFGEINPDQKPVINDLLEASQRLARIVNVFLNVTRIEAGRFVMNFSNTTPFDDIIESVYKELKPTAEKKKVELIYEKTPLPKAEVDTDKIKDVLLNLIDNAIKYTPEGSVAISATADDTELSIIVKDTGVGIPPAEAKNLFEKFVRGSGIAQVQPNGSGLGLFIAKRIVEGHAGKIWVESEGPNKGSTFHVTLPLVAAESAKAKTAEFNNQALKA
jgi:signal transduction histidine kinase